MALTEETSRILRDNANELFFNRHYSEFKKLYPREYIAIQDEGVVDHDKDPEVLTKRIRQVFSPESEECISIGIWYIPAIGEHGAPG